MPTTRCTWRCPPGIVLWEDLLKFIAEDPEHPTFQEFSQHVHQELCPLNQTTPEQEWYCIMVDEWMVFDDDEAERLLPIIEAFENDYEKAVEKWRRLPAPPMVVPSPLVDPTHQETQIDGQDGIGASTVQACEPANNKDSECTAQSTSYSPLLGPPPPHPPPHPPPNHHPPSSTPTHHPNPHPHPSTPLFPSIYHPLPRYPTPTPASASSAVASFTPPAPCSYTFVGDLRRKKTTKT